MTMKLCDDSEIEALTAAIRDDDSGDLAEVDRLLARFPDDARLHFLRGSILAGRQRATEAHSALTRAVELAPDFHIARYQLGFFELTSGEADQALSTWGPLLRLGQDHYLRLFVEGLAHLVRDEFAEAMEKMKAGVAANTENAPLNHDIGLLVAECEKASALGNQARSEPEESDLSATSIMLGRFSPSSTTH
jgi:Flp pilus assembly protein TadD